MAPDSIKAVSPTGSSPALTLPDGRQLAECQAIANYLLAIYDKDGKFGGLPGPANPNCDWLRDEELTSWAGTTLGGLVMFHFVLTISVSMSPWFMKPLMFIGTYPLTKGLTGPKIKSYMEWLQEKLGDEDYLMGKNPGRCDFLVSYQMDVIAHRKIVDLDEFPKLSAWRERILARDAYKSALNKGIGYNWAGTFFFYSSRPR